MISAFFAEYSAELLGTLLVVVCCAIAAVPILAPELERRFYGRR